MTFAFGGNRIAVLLAAGDKRGKAEARFYKALGKTQATVAKKLGLKQETISRVEQWADLLLSTLDGYLKAFGGRLRLVAESLDRAPAYYWDLARLRRQGRMCKAPPA